jgi:hypothetical protein
MHTGMPAGVSYLRQMMQFPKWWWLNPWYEARRQQAMNQAQLNAQMAILLLQKLQKEGMQILSREFPTCRETEVCTDDCRDCPMHNADGSFH